MDTFVTNKEPKLAPVHMGNFRIVPKKKWGYYRAMIVDKDSKAVIESVDSHSVGELFNLAYRRVHKIWQDRQDSLDSL